MSFDRFIDPIISLPRLVKRSVVLLSDAGLCVLTVWIAYYLRLGTWVALSDTGWQATVLSLIVLPILSMFGVYRTVFRHLSGPALVALVRAVAVYGIIYAATLTAITVRGIPRTIGIIQPLLVGIALIASRSLGSYLLGGRLRRDLRRHHRRRNVLIYGAGMAGRQIADALMSSIDVRAIAFVDDDASLHGATVGKLRVWPPEQLAKLITQHAVEEVMLAIPSAGRHRRNEVIRMMQPLGVALRSLPGILDIAHGSVSINDVQQLEIDDLLGRDEVAPEIGLLECNIRAKVVMVTGAGGSIGSELCRQIVAIFPTTLLLVELSEFALYNIHQQLERIIKELGISVEIVPLLASVCNTTLIERIMATWAPNTVYHAAAYKHVPLVEHNPIEGIRNNVIGTWTCVQAAQRFNVANFVLISTDKAVRPTNVMGASKRMAELTLQAVAAEKPSTCFSMVRFGNVLGSRGSVVPLFRAQVAAGGPVTVTHPDISRYFMTIPEASQLVIQAGAMATGGDVFVLDMGQPVKIRDLAVRIIELSGLHVRDEHSPDGDIEIQYSGLRPGEKLYEELLIGADPTRTDHPKVMKANEKMLPLAQLAASIDDLRIAISHQNVDAVLTILRQTVEEYKAAPEVSDWVETRLRADRVIGAPLAEFSS